MLSSNCLTNDNQKGLILFTDLKIQIYKTLTTYATVLTKSVVYKLSILLYFYCKQRNLVLKISVKRTVFKHKNLRQFLKFTKFTVVTKFKTNF